MIPCTALKNCFSNALWNHFPVLHTPTSQTTCKLFISGLFLERFLQLRFVQTILAPAKYATHSIRFITALRPTGYAKKNGGEIYHHISFLGRVNTIIKTLRARKFARRGTRCSFRNGLCHYTSCYYLATHDTQSMRLVAALQSTNCRHWRCDNASAFLSVPKLIDGKCNNFFVVFLCKLKIQIFLGPYELKIFTKNNQFRLK